MEFNLHHTSVVQKRMVFYTHNSLPRFPKKIVFLKTLRFYLD